jgi:hypothetical protein
LIVGVLVVVFGLGVGVGVAVAHGKTSANSSAAVKVAEEERSQLERESSLALRAEQRAVVVEAQVQSVRLHAQQQAWMQQCDSMYPRPLKTTDPKWAADSALQASCIAAVRNGVSPEQFRSKQGP